ncbi:hypothetical protein EMCRGX_G030294 [Ephydatia muelleri]
MVRVDWMMLARSALLGPRVTLQRRRLQWLLEGHEGLLKGERPSPRPEVCRILQVSSALDGQSGLDDVGQECPAGAESDTTVTSPPVAAGGA